LTPERERRLVTALFFGVALLHLLPVWRVDYVPTTDGPSHVYNAVVLRELLTGSPEFARVFEIDSRPHPNWLSHALLGLAMVVATPIIAEKIVVSVIVIVFLAGLWTLAGLIDARNRVYAFLAMPLAFSWPLQMGFYNFSLAAGLMMFALAAWWRRRTAVLALLLVIGYFAHAVPTAVALLLIAAGSRRRLKTLPALIPVSLLFIWFLLQPKLPGGHWTWKGAFLWEPFARLALLLTFDLRQLMFGTAIAIVFAILIVITLIVENRGFKFSERDTFLLLTVLAAVLYFAAPISVEEGLVLKARLLMIPYLVVLPWLTPRLGRWPVAIVLAIVVVANVFFIRNRWKESAKMIAGAVRPIAAASPRRTIVPLIFDRAVPHSILPLLSHASSYGSVDRRLIDFGNYEAALGFFPVKFRDGIHRPAILDVETAPGNYDVDAFAGIVDYVYTWKMPANAPLEARLLARYELASADGEARLYKRK
jgi:hypothetical protein